MPARLSAAALVVAAMLSAPATAAAAPGGAQWAQPGYGAGNTYYNPGESVINAGSVNAVKLRWSSALATPEQWSCSGPSEPLVSGGRVFVTDGKGIAAYQAATGRLSWRHTWANPEDESTPHLAVAGGLLLAANHGCQSQSDPNGAIMALNLVTGRQAWRTATTIPLGSLVVDQGTAVVSGASASDTPAVIGIRASDGAERWSLDDFRSSGVSAGGRVLVGSTTGVETRAVSAATGGTLWSRPTAWTAEAATPAGDRFYASGAEGALICVGAGDGAVLWTAAKGASTLVAADGRRVYRAVTNGIEALNARTGRQAWTARLGGGTGQPVRAGGLLYTAVGGGKPLGIVNAASGVVASPGSQIGSLDRGNVVVTAGWIYLTRGNTIFGYAR